VGEKRRKKKMKKREGDLRWRRREKKK